jgi:hypothetical protein
MFNAMGGAQFSRRSMFMSTGGVGGMPLSHVPLLLDEARLLRAERAAYVGVLSVPERTRRDPLANRDTSVAAIVGCVTALGILSCWAQQMVLLLLLLIPAGLVGPFALVGYGLGALSRIGLRRANRQVWLRSATALLGAAAAALYTWGLLLIAGAVLEAQDGGTDSSPLRPCRTPGQWERALSVVDYTVNYVPLRFVCETKDGGTYAAESVPGYVNPAVLGLALAAAVCAGTAAIEAERGARQDPAM